MKCPHLALCLLATGCFSLDLAQDPPTKHRYLLAATAIPPEQSAATEAAISSLPALHVNKAFVVAPFHEKSLVYRLGENEYTTDYYEEFLVSPSQMITQLTVEWLKGSGTWRRASQSDGATTGHVLDLTVLALYGDYRVAGKQQAVLRLRAKLSLVDAEDDTTPLLESDYDARVSLDDRKAQTLVAGLNRALAQVLDKLGKDLRQHRP